MKLNLKSNQIISCDYGEYRWLEVLITWLKVAERKLSFNKERLNSRARIKKFIAAEIFALLKYYRASQNPTWITPRSISWIHTQSTLTAHAASPHSLLIRRKTGISSLNVNWNFLLRIFQSNWNFIWKNFVLLKFLIAKIRSFEGCTDSWELKFSMAQKKVWGRASWGKC